MNKDFLKTLQLSDKNAGSWSGSHTYSSTEFIDSHSPVDGAYIGSAGITSKNDYDQLIQSAQEAFLFWRSIPAPKRGEIIREIGDELQIQKESLGKLVSYEMGKSLQEGLGEVQEMIDICYFATGLSRQLYGLTMHSERPMHRMYEQWHPLGIVGVISAFNFPVAVWAWNAALAWVCGNVVIWKPSEKTPLCSVACQLIVQKVFKRHHIPDGVSSVINGDYKVGEFLTKDSRIALVSATGSTRMGRTVGSDVAKRFGKSLLELGGNNAMIICPSADLKVVLTSVVFGAVGTAGQRCTSTRRVIIHETIYNSVVEALVKAYSQLKIGNPLEPGIHVGPLIDKQAVDTYQKAIEELIKQGGKFLVNGGVLEGDNYKSGCYVKPCIAEVSHDLPIVHHETFAPILYLIKYKTLQEAIDIQNEVPQGLSSAIMTNVALPMSILEQAEQKSEAPLAVKKKPAVAAKVVLMPGKPTCAAKPIPSIIPLKSLSHRESNLSFRYLYP
jgi:aldehyde dehydrogenase (NAD+)